MPDIIPFDDRDGFIWWNGALIPWRDARPHVLSHGLHYASAVFEGERVYGGKVFRLSAHSERLIQSGRLLGFEIPYTPAEIDAATKLVVQANGCADAYVRPIAWRGSEMMGVAAAKTKINLAIATWDWPSYFTPEAKMKGIRMQLADWRRPSPDTAPTKSKATGLYMICTMSKHKAEDEGFDDALMLDWRGQVAEATGANVFFAREGKLYTPPADCFLDGITRRTVMGLARERQIDVVERAILPSELAEFEECFLTGTAAEVTPVSEIADWRFTPGRMSLALMEDFARATRA